MRSAGWRKPAGEPRSAGFPCRPPWPREGSCSYRGSPRRSAPGPSGGGLPGRPRGPRSPWPLGHPSPPAPSPPQRWAPWGAGTPPPSPGSTGPLPLWAPSGQAPSWRRLPPPPSRGKPPWSRVWARSPLELLPGLHLARHPPWSAAWPRRQTPPRPGPWPEAPPLAWHRPPRSAGPSPGARPCSPPGAPQSKTAPLPGWAWLRSGSARGASGSGAGFLPRP
ncbi:hypothetical protein HRbin38_00340 [bacterium HR38]|nr:hypothetical protein HRbin38_00340 [bacterium HR38]